MDLGNNLEKAFFTDMLANGIPVTEDVSIEKLFTQLVSASDEICTFTVELANDEILVSNEKDEGVLKVSAEKKDRNTRLIFYTNTNEQALENARTIGQILFLLVTICSTLRYLDLNTGRERKTSETIQFESDFV